MKCDVIATGVVEAAKQISLQIPLVVRLEGTNVDLGKQILNDQVLTSLQQNQWQTVHKKLFH